MVTAPHYLNNHKFYNSNPCLRSAFFFLGKGEFMTVPPTRARAGSVAILQSPDFYVEEAGCLQMAYVLSGSESLDIHLQTPGGGPGQQRHLCTLLGDRRSEWHVVAFDLPDGYYALKFSAIIENEKHPKIHLDNITVYDGNCTYDMFGMYEYQVFSLFSSIILWRDIKWYSLMDHQEIF